VRNVRRLQLVFLNLFNEHIQLDMPYKTSSPRRNQYNPMKSVFYAFILIFKPMQLGKGRPLARHVAMGDALSAGGALVLP
jgi:hypothetical protein